MNKQLRIFLLITLSIATISCCAYDFPNYGYGWLTIDPTRPRSCIDIAYNEILRPQSIVCHELAKAANIIISEKQFSAAFLSTNCLFWNFLIGKFGKQIHSHNNSRMAPELSSTCRSNRGVIFGLLAAGAGNALKGTQLLNGLARLFTEPRQHVLSLPEASECATIPYDKEVHALLAISGFALGALLSAK